MQFLSHVTKKNAHFGTLTQGSKNMLNCHMPSRRQDKPILSPRNANFVTCHQDKFSDVNSVTFLKDVVKFSHVYKKNQDVPVFQCPHKNLGFVTCPQDNKKT